MKWELDALKILAKNPTVPGIALQDAISEIERLQRKNNKATPARVKQLEAALIAERKSLLDEGHSWRCAKSDDRRRICTCGLDEAIARIDTALKVQP